MSDARLRELMVRYQSGSPAAFDELYGRLAPTLKGYLVSLCRERSIVEELLQETFLQLHRSRHTYRSDAPLMPWAFAIARHVAYMHRRWVRARPVLTALEDPNLVGRPAGFDERVVARDRMTRALARLPKERRRPLVLHHVFGLDFDEVAARLKIRAGAAKVRASRGRAALRALLGGKEESRR